MEVIAKRFEDPDLREMYEAGHDVSWAGEVIRFREGTAEYRFDLDDLMPGEAIFAKILAEGRETGVKLGRPQGPAFRELPRDEPLLAYALKYLRDNRGVVRIAVYDGEIGFYRRIEISELLPPT